MQASADTRTARCSTPARLVLDGASEFLHSRAAEPRVTPFGPGRTRPSSPGQEQKQHTSLSSSSSCCNIRGGGGRSEE